MTSSNQNAVADATIVNKISTFHNSTSEFDKNDITQLRISYKRCNSIDVF